MDINMCRGDRGSGTIGDDIGYNNSGSRGDSIGSMLVVMHAGYVRRCRC